MARVDDLQQAAIRSKAHEYGSYVTPARSEPLPTDAGPPG